MNTSKSIEGAQFFLLYYNYLAVQCTFGTAQNSVLIILTLVLTFWKICAIRAF
jgi:hypothetical protein